MQTSPSGAGGQSHGLKTLAYLAARGETATTDPTRPTEDEPTRSLLRRDVAPVLVGEIRLLHGGTLERAAAIAGHASTRTTQLYDRRHELVEPDEIERVKF
jgi:hypothetical protein